LNYIIKIQNGLYFAGWNSFGDLTFTEKEEYAYRMRNYLANQTANKIINFTNGNCFIIDVNTQQETEISYTISYQTEHELF